MQDFREAWIDFLKNFSVFSVSSVVNVDTVA